MLLGLAGSLFEEQTSLQKLVQLMMSHAREYLHCRRIALYVLAPPDGTITAGFENVNEAPLETRLLCNEQLRDSPFGALARYVSSKRQVIRINGMSDYSDCCAELARLLRSVAVPVNQFLSVPIYNAHSAVVGVVQLLNKVVDCY